MFRDAFESAGSGYRRFRDFLRQNRGIQRALTSAVIIIVLYYSVRTVVAVVTAPRIEMTMSPIAGPVAVRAKPAEKGQISYKVTYTGTVIPYQEVNVSPRVQGFLERIAVDVGDKVKEGQILVQLDKVELRARKEEVTARKIAAQSKLEEIRAQRIFMEKEFERDKTLFENGAISGTAFDRTRAEYEARKAAEEAQLSQIKSLEAAEQAAARVLSYTDILAPITGEVTERIKLINPGELVMPGTVLLKLADLRRVRVQANVAEGDVAKARIGTPALVRFPALPEGRNIVQARVTAVFPELDPVSRTARVEIAVDNPSGLIRPEMYAIVDLILERKTDAIVIPRTAVIQLEGKQTVFVTDAVVAMARPVKLGIFEGDRVEVLDGVKEGEMVIVDGQRGLTDGQQVSIVAGF